MCNEGYAREAKYLHLIASSVNVPQCSRSIRCKMSFTFGGFPTFLMERVSTTSLSLHPPEEKRIKMKDFLSERSHLFTLEPILIIIRDYILGASLLMIDLFPSTQITMHEIHILLCSVACCHECTEEVWRLAEKCIVTEVKGEDIPNAPHGFVDILAMDPVGAFFSMKNICEYYSSLLASKYMLMKNLASLNKLATVLKGERRRIIAEARDNILGSRYWTSKEPSDIYDIIYRASARAVVSILALITFCLNLMQVDEVNILKRKTSGIVIYHDERIASILTACSTSPHFSGKQIKYNLSLLRKNFDRSSFYLSLDRAGSIVPTHFITRNDLSFRLSDWIVICMYRNADALEVSGNPYLLMHFLWQLPLAILRRYATVIKEGGSDGKYLTSMVSYDQKIHHLQLGVVEMGDRSVAAYAYNNEVNVMYHVLLYIIADKFLWSCDRNHVMSMLKRMMIPSHVLEIEAATYEDPVQHLIVPIGGKHVFGSHCIGGGHTKTR